MALETIHLVPAIYEMMKLSQSVNIERPHGEVESMKLEFI